VSLLQTWCASVFFSVHEISSGSPEIFRSRRDLLVVFPALNLKEIPGQFTLVNSVHVQMRAVTKNGIPMTRMNLYCSTHK